VELHVHCGMLGKLREVKAKMVNEVPGSYSKAFLRKFGHIVFERQMQLADNGISNKWYIRSGASSIDIQKWLLPQVKSKKLIDLVKFNKWDVACDKRFHDYVAHEILKYVRSSIKYTSDVGENWQTAEETFDRKRGDCIAKWEEIITKDGIKSAEEIKVGDIVLSYDFNKKDYVYKPIINVWNKGIKDIKRVHFRNGQHIDVTEEHHMLVRQHQKKSEYVKTDLKDVDLTRWWKRKVPIAIKIPYEVTAGINVWLDEDLMFIIGHFLAEGWHGKDGKVGTCGYEINEYIIPLLEKKDIPFTEGKNNSGVPTINFLKSDFKHYLRTLKNNSFDIHLPEHIFHQSENKLTALLNGFWLGDGHNGNYPDKRGWASNKQEVYSTSSQQLAEDIQRIGLHIGKTFHIWKQENHGGLGNEPIWRITYNPKSHFLKDFGYSKLSEVSISYIEDLGKHQTYDWEVEDTHNFFFKNGICTSQCEDGSILLLVLASIAGIPHNRIRLQWGKVVGGGHAYIIYNDDIGLEKVLDWCYWYTSIIIRCRKWFGLEKNYINTWGLARIKK